MVYIVGTMLGNSMIITYKTATVLGNSMVRDLKTATVLGNRMVPVRDLQNSYSVRKQNGTGT